jgi:hypothetical protein
MFYVDHSKDLPRKFKRYQKKKKIGLNHSSQSIIKNNSRVSVSHQNSLC